MHVMLECLAPGQKMVFILILHDCLMLHVESDCDDHDVIVYSFESGCLSVDRTDFCLTLLHFELYCCED